MTVHPDVIDVTDRIAARSAASRRRTSSASAPPPRAAPPAASSGAPTSPTASPRAAPTTSCTCAPPSARTSRSSRAYNDMLSAHQPLERYPAQLKRAVAEAGGVAQFAGGVPAMCDGITQGRTGMELSLFSRDVVAMATAVALSHDMFDGALLLGVCDKIVPGLLIGALSFGQLPTVLVPAGPMPSGLPNKREERDPPAPRRGQGRRGRAARRGVAVLPRARHVHVLRHGEHEPARRRGDGPAPPGRELRQPGHAAAQGAHRRGGAPRAGPHRARVGLRADRRARRREGDRQRASSRCWPAAARRTTRCTSSPIAAAAGIRLTWDDFADLSAIVPLLATHLSERRRRHQPVPRRGRHGVPVRPAARRRAHASPTCGRSPASGWTATARSRTSTTTARCAGARRPAASRDESVLRPAARAVRARRRHPRARRRRSAAR